MKPRDRMKQADHAIPGFSLFLRAVAGQRYRRLQNQELLRFLRRVDSEISSGLRLQLILDDCGSRRHPRLQFWLQENPRFVAHFVPPDSSWLEMVSRSAAERKEFESGGTKCAT